jgi:hypothetical protein
LFPLDVSSLEAFRPECALLCMFSAHWPRKGAEVCLLLTCLRVNSYTDTENIAVTSDIVGFTKICRKIPVSGQNSPQQQTLREAHLCGHSGSVPPGVCHGGGKCLELQLWAPTWNVRCALSALSAIRVDCFIVTKQNCDVCHKYCTTLTFPILFKIQLFKA